MKKYISMICVGTFLIGVGVGIIMSNKTHGGN